MLIFQVSGTQFPNKDKQPVAGRKSFVQILAD